MRLIGVDHDVVLVVDEEGVAFAGIGRGRHRCDGSLLAIGPAERRLELSIPFPPEQPAQPRRPWDGATPPSARLRGSYGLL
jgi:hypothetical protein